MLARLPPPATRLAAAKTAVSYKFHGIQNERYDKPDIIIRVRLDER
jgi:hypothetical protein